MKTKPTTKPVPTCAGCKKPIVGASFDDGCPQACLFCRRCHSVKRCATCGVISPSKKIVDEKTKATTNVCRKCGSEDIFVAIDPCWVLADAEYEARRQNQPISASEYE